MTEAEDKTEVRSMVTQQYIDHYYIIAAGGDYGGYQQQQHDYNYDRGRGRGRGSRGGGRGYGSGGGGRSYEDFKEPSPGSYIVSLSQTAFSSFIFGREEKGCGERPI